MKTKLSISIVMALSIFSLQASATPSNGTETTEKYDSITTTCRGTSDPKNATENISIAKSRISLEIKAADLNNPGNSFRVWYKKEDGGVTLGPLNWSNSASYVSDSGKTMITNDAYSDSTSTHWTSLNPPSKTTHKQLYINSRRNGGDAADYDVFVHYTKGDDNIVRPDKICINAR